MKGKKLRITAWLLMAAILTADFCGNGTVSYAAEVTADDGVQELSGMELDFAKLLEEYDMYGVVMGGEKIAIRLEASEDAPVVQMLPSGYQVKFLAAVCGEERWFQVAFGVNDREYTGYVQESYVVTQDERMAQWKNQYSVIGKARILARVSVAQGKTDLSLFPSSYRSYIKKLVEAHPNWTFVPMNTGLKWSDVIANEMKDAVNLVETNNVPATWKSTAAKDYDMSTGKWIVKNGTTWVQASESIVKYFIDPRNFLNEESVFQFEQLTYSQDYHTQAGVEKILSGTFMSKKKLEDGSGGGITYAKAFMKIGKALKVSPYFLASRVRQEQGVNGTSGLISGKYKGYKGYYNYFNIQATGVGEQVVISGLQEAKAAGWNTRYKALKGGAERTADNYIKKGQDTLYLQKFDVDASYSGIYWHQYMQNLQAANNEGKSVRNSYISMGLIDNGFVFKVPVYTNMPSKACPYPGEKLSKPSLSVTKGNPGVVKLSWDEIGGAQGYQVYRREGEDGKYVRIKTVKSLTKLSYQDKTAVPGKVYYYKVRAFLKLYPKNQYSSYSAVKEADCRVAATSWRGFTVSGDTVVQLAWNEANVTGYKIYRKTDSGKFTRIKTVKKSTTVSYNDKKVEAGHTYSYRIRGYLTLNGKKYYSAYTSVNKADIKK